LLIFWPEQRHDFIYPASATAAPTPASWSRSPPAALAEQRLGDVQHERERRGRDRRAPSPQPTPDSGVR
jgi:hypothetical protein